MTTGVQVVLAPTEAKRLLSKAVLQLEEVKRALEDGIVIIHPSSTTIFMLEELGHTLSDDGIWICGHISPKGLCISRKMIDAATASGESDVDHCRKVEKANDPPTPRPSPIRPPSRQSTIDSNRN